MKSLTFFLLKEKNGSTSERARAAYFWNFCKSWVSRNISMFRRVRSTCRRTSYVHKEGTEISYIRHKNRKFLCLLCATCVPGVCAQCVHILGGATHLLIQHLSFPTPCPDCSNSSWLFLKLQLKFCQKLKSDEPALNDVFKELSRP